MVAVYTSDFSGPAFGTSSYPDYVDFGRAGNLLSGLAAYTPRPFSLSTDGSGIRTFGETVSDNYFSVLGVKPALGRFFTPEPAGTRVDPVVVLGYGLWQRVFGGTRDVLGRSVKLSGRDYTVIGVAPQGFGGSIRGVGSELWLPLATLPYLMPGSDELTNRGDRGLFLIGRLAAGMSVAQAEARLDVVGRQLHGAYAKAWTDHTGSAREVTVLPERATRVPPQMRGSVSRFMALLLGISALVLVICCANVANLLLARATARRRELATRLAIGGSRARVVRQLLTEGLVLAVLGGSAGVLLSLWATDMLSGLRPPVPVPVVLDFTIDSRILLFSLCATVLTTLASALVPALRATRLEAGAGLRMEAAGATVRHGRFGLRDGLVIAQVAVSLVVLAAAGLFLTSLRNATRIDLGFSAERAALMQVELGIQGYDEPKGRQFYAGLERRVRSIHGVEAASLAEIVPLGMARQRRGISVEGYQPGQGEEMEFGTNTVGTDYFKTLGIPLLRGRAFDERDREGAPPVAIVNQTFADRFWPGADPIGRRFSSGKGGTLEVIGVAANGKYVSLGEESQPYFYQPFLQTYEPDMVLQVRAAGEPRELLAALRAEAKVLDPDLPVELTTLDEHLGYAVLPQRLGATVLGAFGGIGVLLAALGLYGVMSYAVSQRTAEIGVRMALGASAGDVRRMVVRRGMLLALLGIGLGLAGAVAATRLLSGFLVGVRSTDPANLGAVVFLFAMVALLASSLPAHRAARLDPMRALRTE
ncbi:MAG: ABC transporter permease [Gemmatimonadota bacterium]|nr:ABC transporter permease [Gemmatimonadota bacterium]